MPRVILAPVITYRSWTSWRLNAVRLFRLGDVVAKILKKFTLLAGA
jgi:hypothetical protein